MRQVTLLVVWCAGTASLLGAAVPARAVTDPVCGPSGNSFGIPQFSVYTPESSWEYEVSSVVAYILACGTELYPGMPTYELGGSGSQFVRLETSMPPGVEIGRTATILPGSYAGRASVTVNSWWGTPRMPFLAEDQPAELRVDRVAGTDCPDGSVACFKVTGKGSFNWHAWTWETGQRGSYDLIMGPIYNDVFTQSPAGLTNIGVLVLCGYAGTPSGSSCGDAGQPFLHKNGRAYSPPECYEEGGAYYAVRATARSRDTTDWRSACVDWYQREEFGE